jgi:cytoskeletal protein RodZ
LKIAPEYLLGGILALIVLAIVAVVGVTSFLIIVGPPTGMPSIGAAPQTTTPTTVEASTTSTSTTSTSSSTTSSSTTSTSTSTSTTRAPLWVCEKTIVEKAMITSKCIGMDPGSTAQSGKRDINATISCTATYNLTNAIGAYSDFNAKVSGEICEYVLTRWDPKLTPTMPTCDFPRNYTKTLNSTLTR